MVELGMCLWFSCKPNGFVLSSLNTQGEGEGVLPYKRLMGMCCWMGSHFHDWIDFNGVAYSIELLEWAHIFSDFWGRKVLHIYKQQMYQNVCTVVFFIQFKKFVNSLYGDLFKRFIRQIHKQTVTKLESQKLNICPKGAKMESIIGHRIDYDGVGALRGQRDIPSKN